MKLHLSPEHLISVFQRGGQTGAWLFGAEPSHPGNTAGVTVPPASPPGVPVVQDREGWTSAMSGDVNPVPGHWLEELARDWVCKGHGYYQISIRSSYGQVRVQVWVHMGASVCCRWGLCPSWVGNHMGLECACVRLCGCALTWMPILFCGLGL